MKKLFSLLILACSMLAFVQVASAADGDAQQNTTKKIRATTRSGVIYEMEQTGTDAAGEPVYKITAVLTKVTTPSGATVEIAVNAPTLVGATVTGIPTNFTSGATLSAPVSIVPAGSNTPLTASQIVTTLSTAVSTAVTTAVQNGVLPAGTAAPVVTVADTLVAAPGTVVVNVVTPTNDVNQRSQSPTGPT